MLISIELQEQYIQICYYNKHLKKYEFLKINEKEQIETCFYFDTEWNVIISNNNDDNKQLFNHFISDIFHSPTKNITYSIQYCGETKEVNQFVLFYFFLNDIISKLIKLQEIDSNEINKIENVDEIMIILPDNLEMKSEIISSIQSIIKRFNFKNQYFLDQSNSYAGYQLLFNKEFNQIETNSILIINKHHSLQIIRTSYHKFQFRLQVEEMKTIELFEKRNERNQMKLKRKENEIFGILNNILNQSQQGIIFMIDTFNDKPNQLTLSIKDYLFENYLDEDNYDWRYKELTYSKTISCIGGHLLIQKLKSFKNNQNNFQLNTLNKTNIKKEDNQINDLLNELLNLKLVFDGIQIVKQWMNEQKEYSKETESFNELVKVMNEIIDEKDLSEIAYEDIRYLLRPFEEELPLKIKRIFNIAMMDHYTMFIASRHFKTIEDYCNLEIGIRRFQGNSTKFHYNPIPITGKTKHLFPNVETWYKYTSNDSLIQDYSSIITPIKIDFKSYYFINEKDQTYLEKWTGLKYDDIIFDSNVDNWNISTSVLNEKIRNKTQIVFLIEDKEGEKFGYYYNDETISSSNGYKGKNKSFHFNLESKNNRLNEPMKFEMNDTNDCGIGLFNVFHEELIRLGDKLPFFIRCATNL